eukprot:gene6675-3340_t
MTREVYGGSAAVNATHLSKVQDYTLEPLEGFAQKSDPNMPPSMVQDMQKMLANHMLQMKLSYQRENVGNEEGSYGLVLISCINDSAAPLVYLPLNCADPMPPMSGDHLVRLINGDPTAGFSANLLAQLPFVCI